MSQTKILKLDPERPDRQAIELAAKVIRDGGLVAFPTETVYGLGADAINEAAVGRIFEVKARPADNPLIVHISRPEMLELIARPLDQKARLLVSQFWPGPLTLVLERKPGVAQAASAGLNTIAVRMPKSAVALELIRAAQTPIAAPSANTSGRPSPTSAEHVACDLGGKIEVILDGGTTNIGIESTVLDLTADPPAILRPGWITREMIAELIGQVEVAASMEELKRSPGTRYRHYSPRAKLILIEATASGAINQVCSRMLERGAVGFIGHTRPSIQDPRLLSIILTDSPEDYARSIYAALRELDQKDPAAIVVQGISDAGHGAAVMDRLRRAASEIINAAQEN